MTVRRYRRLAIGFLLAVSVATAASAQFRGRFRGPSAKMATPEDFDGNFLFCRILFRNAPTATAAAGASTTRAPTST